MISTEQWRAVVGRWVRGLRPRGGRGPTIFNTVTCMLSVVMCSALIQVLLVIGGVESNPGPDPTCSDAFLEELRAGQRNILERLDGQSNLLLELKSFQQRVEVLETRVVTLEAENKNLSRKVDYLENQSRRNNLLVFGLDDREGESWSDSECLVHEVAQQVGVELDERDIERAHRVGRRRGRRPIVVKLASYKKREELLRAAARCLRGTGVRVAEDFSATVRQTRFQLGPYLQDAREKGLRANLRFDRLVVEGRSYALDELEALSGEQGPQQNTGPRPPTPQSPPAPSPSATAQSPPSPLPTPQMSPSLPPPPSPATPSSAAVTAARESASNAARARSPAPQRPRATSVSGERQRPPSPAWTRVTRSRGAGAWVPGRVGSGRGAAKTMKPGKVLQQKR